MNNNNLTSTKEYKDWLTDIKQRLRSAQTKAAIAVNTELLKFYWELGTDIVEKQKTAKWGTGFLKQLSLDLKAEFHDLKGFSEANLRFIRRWVLFYTTTDSNSVTTCDQITGNHSNLLVQIPWGHNREIISKCDNTEEALFYVHKTIENN